MSTPQEPPPSKGRPRSFQGSGFSALRHRGFAFYLGGRFLAVFAVQIVSVAVGWQVYDLTRDPLDLGIVGLVQFLPAFVLVLVTGAVADRYNRRFIMLACLFGEALCALALLIFVLSGQQNVLVIFATLLVLGILRAFFGPAQQAMTPNLVPVEDLSNAIAWGSSAWQVATIVGPVMGGLLYGLSPVIAYGAATMLLATAAILALFIPPTRQIITGEKASWATLLAGFRYIAHEKVVLGAISLDLFAVLLGGATALLPAYARDILDVGPWGLGFLRAGPGIGAIAVAAWLAAHSIRDRAGVIMLVCVAMFGLFTIVFGVSTWVGLSVLALVLMGAFDMVSVYIRETLIQLWTPDHVRGRVNAVNGVFIGASNELGEFRAGVSASLIGVVPAVVVGGIGTLLVAALWWRIFPALRNTRHLDGRA